MTVPSPRCTPNIAMRGGHLLGLGLELGLERFFELGVRVRVRVRGITPRREQVVLLEYAKDEEQNRH